MRLQRWNAVVTLGVLGLACGGTAPEASESASVEQALGVDGDVNTARALAVTAVRGFLDEPAEITWVRSSALAWNRSVPVDVYRAGRFQFEVNARTGEVLQFGPSPLERPEEETLHPEALTRPRMDVTALEERAREYIARQAGVDLSELKTRHSSKDELAYFFRWIREPSLSGKDERFIQAGLAADGRVLSYTNVLDVSEQVTAPLVQSYLYASSGGYYSSYGPTQYWWTVNGEGYCGHITTNCSPSSMRYTYENATRLNYAIWDVIDLNYSVNVQAFIPRVHATTPSAHYTFQRWPGSPYREKWVNQTWYSDVWVDITPSDLSSLTSVMLEDKPGVTADLNRKVAFDEIQVF